jgi:hypothetical protein
MDFIGLLQRMKADLLPLRHGPMPRTGLLCVNCVGASRHAGLDPASMNTVDGNRATTVFMDSSLRGTFA